MMKKLHNIFKPSNRSLIRELVVSDFRLRYQNSVLGYVWSLLRPLMMFGVLYIVFTKIIKLGGAIPYYASYLLLGLVLWTFFVEATVAGLNSIVGRGDMIRKVSIPKYTIVISSVLSAFVTFLLNMFIVFIFMAIQHVPFRPTILLTPLYMGELIVFCLGISFLLSALFVKLRDISQVWDVGLQVLFYATPIIYPISQVPPKLLKPFMLNPLSQIIQDMRSLMITPGNIPATLTAKAVYHSQIGRILPMLIVLGLTVFAAWYFKRSSKNFAEEL
jgi:ABC-2 type transport system permease protein